MIKNLGLNFLFLSFLFSEADHVIFSKITITPNNAEMVAIHNPTEEAINLSNYYLSDAEYSLIGRNYYNLPSGNDFWSTFSSDFFVKFPENYIINAGQTIEIGLHDIASFNTFYGYNPDLTIQDNMLNVPENENTIGSSNDLLGNSYEVLILFFWDGISQTVKDVDYFYWGNEQGLDQFGINKTGVDSYYDDTSFEVQSQNILSAHIDGQSFLRKSNVEIDENVPGIDGFILGNGITGHDETSEVFNESWEIITQVGCGIPEDPLFNEDALTQCPDSNNNGFGDCCAAESITHSIEEIVTGTASGFTATIRGLIVGFGDYRQPNNGPQVIELMDPETGHVIDLVIWDWDVITPTQSSVSYMVDPTNLTDYVILATGTVGIYNGSFQFTIDSENNITEYYGYNPQGEFVLDENIKEVEIIPAPYVVIPTLGERLDYRFTVPSNSKVVIRIFDFNGNFVTSLLDDFFISSGTIERYDDGADWDGKDHHGQIVAPGTYLMHIEATNWLTGQYSTDSAPIVVGVYK